MPRCQTTSAHTIQLLHFTTLREPSFRMTMLGKEHIITIFRTPVVGMLSHLPTFVPRRSMPRPRTLDYTLKKSLGQHFLHDEGMCRRIVDSVTHTSGRRLLEVGPGGGAITKYLLEWPDVDYKAVEIDREKVAYLLEHYPAIAGKIIEADVLRMVKPFEEAFSVVGNFPYNISSPIMFRVLEWSEDVEEVVGMFQKEVAQRIAAGPGSKMYGILSVLMQAFFEVKYLFDVPPGCFTPPPKVMSGVLRFTSIGNPLGIDDKKKFIRLVKAAFGQRRKTLRNALRGTLPESALSVDEVMGKRAEQLPVTEFARLYHQYLAV